jgi:putative membrane protein
MLMGLANLVPGISGGTMLLAAGVYPRFIKAVAEVTTLRFKTPSVVVLGAVVGSACAAILFLAGTVKGLVIDYRWIMYSLFIGLTLGGVPVVWRMIGRPTRAMWVGVVVGFAGMALLAWRQQAGATAAGGGSSNFLMLFLAGVAGASAMILPGVSGGYLLLVLGQYVPILSAIDTFKDALAGRDVGTLLQVGFTVMTPVGLGVLAGVVGVSNLLGFLLRRYEKATLGVLLGLLLGAVVGLWPFQGSRRPEPGEMIKGRPVTEATLAEIDPEDYPTEYFRPTARHLAVSVVLILAGFGVTLSISRFGGGAGGADREAPEPEKAG